MAITILKNLVGGFNHLEKYEFVSWDDSSHILWKIKFMSEITNQIHFYLLFYWPWHKLRHATKRKTHGWIYQWAGLKREHLQEAGSSHLRQLAQAQRVINVGSARRTGKNCLSLMHAVGPLEDATHWKWWPWWTTKSLASNLPSGKLT